MAQLGTRLPLYAVAPPRPDGRSRAATHSTLIMMPAYNESACVADVVASARRAMPNTDVLVIDDGSSDDTSARAKSAGALVVRHPFNLGIGGAVQTGLKFAQRMGYDYVLRMDSDGQHDARQLPRLLSIVEAGDADVAVGSRFLDGAEANMRIAPMRRLGIGVFARQVTLVTHQPTTDATSGMVAMDRPAIRLLAKHMPQDYPEVECRIILHRAGLRTVEAPVTMRERQGGVSSIDNLRSFYYAVKVTVSVLLTAIKRYV